MLTGILAIGIVAGVAVVALGGGGDGGDGDGARPPAESDEVELPAQRTSEVEEAVATAGCELTHPPIEGDDHEQRAFTAADYATNPPTSGDHFPPPAAQDGVYEAGSTPELGTLVHSLEHGRINVQYAPGTDAALLRRLEAFVAENGGYHMLLYENATGMEARVAATAWGHSLTCENTGPPMWDALRTFRDRYVDQAPERVP